MNTENIYNKHFNIFWVCLFACMLVYLLAFFIIFFYLKQIYFYNNAVHLYIKSSRKICISFLLNIFE